MIGALLEGPRRFGELAEAIDGIAPNVLSSRLRALERDGLVVAERYSERPPRSVYHLTAAGAELAGVLRLLAAWGARQTGGEPLTHDACGTPLDARWYCPTCAATVEEADAADDLHYL